MCLCLSLNAVGACYKEIAEERKNERGITGRKQDNSDGWAQSLKGFEAADFPDVTIFFSFFQEPFRHFLALQTSEIRFDVNSSLLRLSYSNTFHLSSTHHTIFRKMV